MQSTSKGLVDVDDTTDAIECELFISESIVIIVASGRGWESFFSMGLLGVGMTTVSSFENICCETLTSDPFRGEGGTWAFFSSSIRK